MKIAVMGAGAIGAYVGARLAQAGADVALIARGRHLDAIRRNGVRIESPLGEVGGLTLAATDDPSDIGVVDVVIFSVKLWDTETAAKAMQPLIGPNTRIVTLQNGIDSVDTISDSVPAEQVVGGAIYLFAVIDRPGVIRNSGGVHRMIFGTGGGDPVLRRLAETLDRAPGIDTEQNGDIGRTIWQKYLRLVPLSAATALTRRPIGEVRGNAVTRQFLQSLLAEVAGVAGAEGFSFAGDQVGEGLAFYDALPAGFKSSMLEDVERGNRLELPWLSSRVCELGKRHGIATPANWAAHCGLHLLAGGSQA